MTAEVEVQEQGSITRNKGKKYSHDVNEKGKRQEEVAVMLMTA